MPLCMSSDRAAHLRAAQMPAKYIAEPSLLGPAHFVASGISFVRLAGSHGLGHGALQGQLLLLQVLGRAVVKLEL
jgi:hypothetical protein